MPLLSPLPVTPAAWRMLAFLSFFYAMLGGMELLFPAAACRDGLAGPLTSAGATPDAMCQGIESNPAAQLIFFGLAKYHVLMGAITVYALQRGDGETSRAALLLSAINFAADDSWAAAHLRWIGAGPVVLLPQALLAAGLAYVALG
jgi:hypothetical protein